MPEAIKIILMILVAIGAVILAFFIDPPCLSVL